jgi:hypothetical protein
MTTVRTVGSKSSRKLFLPSLESVDILSPKSIESALVETKRYR